MLTIRLSKRLLVTPIGWIERGSKIALPDAYAKRLIEEGYAGHVTPDVTDAPPAAPAEWIEEATECPTE